MEFYNKFSSLLFVAFISIFLVVGCKEDYETPASLEADKSSKQINALAGSKAFCELDVTARISEKRARSSTNNSRARMVVLNTTIYNTDYVSAGAAGMRNVGSGTISLSGVSGTVTKAYLYWHGITNATTDVGNSITVNTTTVAGTNIGVSSDNCWGHDNSQAYRADVTTLVQSTGNGSYNLGGFGSLDPNGASLVVFFNDGNNTNNRDVVIFEGNDSNINFPGIVGNPNAPADPQGWDILLSGINYTTGTANIQLHVADGQEFLDDAIHVNAVELVPTGGIFQGTSVPGGGLWDIKTFDVTSFLSPGPNSLNLTTGTYVDCLGLIVALVDLPAGAAPVTEIAVAFDVKPTSCPNPLNRSEKGVIPMAILGAAGFDVTKIDVSTIKVNGVSPIRWSIEDVATPYAGTVTNCFTCTTAGPDGIPDLTLKFTNQELSQSIGSAVSGSCINLTLTGNLLPANGSTPIKGLDYVRINK